MHRLLQVKSANMQEIPYWWTVVQKTIQAQGPLTVSRARSHACHLHRWMNFSLGMDHGDHFVCVPLRFSPSWAACQIWVSPSLLNVCTFSCIHPLSIGTCNNVRSGWELAQLSWRWISWDDAVWHSSAFMYLLVIHTVRLMWAWKWSCLTTKSKVLDNFLFLFCSDSWNSLIGSFCENPDLRRCLCLLGPLCRSSLLHSISLKRKKFEAHLWSF